MWATAQPRRSSPALQTAVCSLAGSTTAPCLHAAPTTTQEHLRDNPHILNYYRSGYGFRRSLKSLFALHNETGNIWTHLIGGCWSALVPGHREAR